MELTNKPQADELVTSRYEAGLLTVTLNRPEERNALCSRTVIRLHAICDQVEQDDDIRLIVLRGSPPVFSSGLDFALAEDEPKTDDAQNETQSFASLLHRLSHLPAIVVAHVEGDAIAGGVGLAAACDVVIAHPSVRFRLTEIIWGLLPANIAPYLIRRMGFQRAYRMVLTCASVDATQAETYGLADFVSVDPGPLLRDLRTNSQRTTRDNLRSAKGMFENFWILDEPMRAQADELMHQTFANPNVRHALRRYREFGLFPWEPDR